jgi:hypothetical protein
MKDKLIFLLRNRKSAIRNLSFAMIFLTFVLGFMFMIGNSINTIWGETFINSLFIYGL